MLFSATALRRLVTIAGLVLLAASVPTKIFAQDVKVGAKSIGGVVTSAKGAEAGVWVIAETTELPTKFARIVVTDDSGRYVIPDLPDADYSVWVRGYGLVDSPKMRAKPGQHLDLMAVAAPNAAEAAHYYPAIYWYTMMKIPPASEFGGSGAIPAKLTQNDWLKQMNNVDCIGCHQLGQESTRTIPAAFGKFNSGEEAWMRRTQAGQAGENMTNRLAGQWGGVPYKYFGDWTDRIAKGELPKETPPRPQGIERNIVVTSWEWSTPDKYLHDLISSDRRHPTVNAYGPLYGSPEYSTDNMPILDPKTNKVSFFRMPVRDPDMPESLGPGHAASVKPLQPSAYWGDRQLWNTRANNHNSEFDNQGRVWLAATVRGQANPGWCKKGSDNLYAKVFPIEKSQRQVAMLDPKTMKYTFVDTCFSTHHPQFGYDADNTLWFSGTGPVAGWIDTKVFDETGDTQKAQGWAPWVLDINGNGKLDDFTEPGAPADPAQGRAHHRRFRAILRHAEPKGRLDLVRHRHVRGPAGLPALRSEDQAVGGLLHSEARLRHPRRRHRRQRRALGLGLERPSHELRPQQVQRSAQRADRDRQSLSGGLGLLQISRPRL